LKKLYISLIWILIIQTALPAYATNEGSAPSFSIEFSETEVIFQAKEILVRELLDKIKEDISVEIKGLEPKPDDLVTFSSKGTSSEIVLRQLLRHLGEKNFAYVYEDDRLIRITVFPQGTYSEPRISQNENKHKKKSIRVVEITGILEDSQAEKLDIKKGDYIIKYDGVRVSMPEELIKETTKGKDPTPVDMIILQNGKPKRVFLEKGFIGIRVRTKKIQPNELPNDINSW